MILAGGGGRVYSAEGGAGGTFRKGQATVEKAQTRERRGENG